VLAGVKGVSWEDPYIPPPLSMMMRVRHEVRRTEEVIKKEGKAQ